MKSFSLSVSTPEKIDKVLETLDRYRASLMYARPGPPVCRKEIEGLGRCGLAPYHLFGCVTADGRRVNTRTPNPKQGAAP